VHDAMCIGQAIVNGGMNGEASRIDGGRASHPGSCP
jgi:hypothetical protein